MMGDRLALAIEASLVGEKPLLQRVMNAGQRLSAPVSLDAIAQRTATAVSALPLSVRRLQTPEPLPITLSHGLEKLTQCTRQNSL